MMSVSIGVAVLVMAPVVPVSMASASSSDPPPPDRTALVLGGTSVPTPDARYIDIARVLFIEPTQPPGQQVNYVAVTTPEEGGPITGVLRVLLLVVNPDLARLDGPVWPKEPLWKLSGIFDLSIDQSVAAGVPLLEQEIARHPGDHLIIFGYSQGALVALVEKEKLAAQFPEGTDAPDISFVLIGDPRTPNGGLYSRFPGVPIPIFGTSTGPEPTDTQFHTDVYTRQYDGFADFPLYPVNLVSTANAVLGLGYSHGFYFSPAPDDPPAVVTTTGDTVYHFQPVNDLPLFGPLRTVGVPEPVIDVVEPVARVIVEQGYDRTIPPGTPTPARLVPPPPTRENVRDVVGAVGEGVHNATKLTPKSLTDGFKFTPPKLGSATGDNQTGGLVARVGANIGDSLQQVGENVEKTIKKATDRVTKGFTGLNGHNIDSKG